MRVQDLIPSEHDEQVTVIEWRDIMALRDPRYKRLYAIPNGGARNKRTAGMLKAEGVMRGIPDLSLPIPRGDYFGMFIEMKRRNGGRLSPEQKDWISFLSSQGYKCIVAHGADEAIEAIKNYIEEGL